MFHPHAWHHPEVPCKDQNQINAHLLADMEGTRTKFEFIELPEERQLVWIVLLVTTYHIKPHIFGPNISVHDVSAVTVADRIG